MKSSPSLKRVTTATLASYSVDPLADFPLGTAQKTTFTNRTVVRTDTSTSTRDGRGDTSIDTSSSTDDSGVAGPSSGGSGQLAIPALPQHLLNLAEALDKHIQEHAVSSMDHLKPDTEVETTSITADWGKRFTIKLSNPTGAHVLKPSETSDRSIAEPTRNGSAEGNYEFIGNSPGTTTIKIIVAREDTLAIGTRDVSVTVVGA